MGIHIIVYKTDFTYDEEYGYLNAKDVSKEVGWDILRRSGDKDFASQWNQFDVLADHKARPEERYYRPIDLDKSIEWVKGNVVEGNQQRLIDILEKMRQDKGLYFLFSY